MKRTALRGGLLGVVLLFGAVPGAWALPNERWSLPPSMQLTVVSDGMRVNGVDTQVYAFVTPESADALAEHFRGQWRGRIQRSIVPPWDILTHRDRGRLAAVQMQPDVGGGTRGLISISNLFERAPSRPPQVDVPLAPRTWVHQVIDADDAGIRSRTWVLLSRLSADEQLDFYREHYRSQGYEPVSRRALVRGESAGALMLNRGATQANVAVAERDGLSMVTIVTVNP